MSTIPGNVVVLTGASSGIGEASALLLAARGARYGIAATLRCFARRAAAM